MDDNTFFEGDYVEIVCDDGATFHGRLSWHQHYLLLNGYGYATDQVVDMRHWRP